MSFSHEIHQLSVEGTIGAKTERSVEDGRENRKKQVKDDMDWVIHFLSSCLMPAHPSLSACVCNIIIIMSTRHIVNPHLSPCFSLLWSFLLLLFPSSSQSPPFYLCLHSSISGSLSIRVEPGEQNFSDRMWLESRLDISVGAHESRDLYAEADHDENCTPLRMHDNDYSWIACCLFSLFFPSFTLRSRE